MRMEIGQKEKVLQAWGVLSKIWERTEYTSETQLQTRSPPCLVIDYWIPSLQNGFNLPKIFLYHRNILSRFYNKSRYKSIRFAIHRFHLWTTSQMKWKMLVLDFSAALSHCITFAFTPFFKIFYKSTELQGKMCLFVSTLVTLRLKNQ